MSRTRLRNLSPDSSARLRAKGRASGRFHVARAEAAPSVSESPVVAETVSAADSRPTEELTPANADLETRVRERTRALESMNGELSRTAHDLAATLQALAEANARLEQEKATRERVEAELRLAHRLEAVGQLAAGVAHEINTPIQYVSDSVLFLQSAFEDLLPIITTVSNVSSSLRHGGSGDLANALDAAWRTADADFLLEQVPPAIGRALEGLERVAAIVQAMKAFAHPGSEDMAPADINAALTTTMEVCRNEYKYVADVVKDFGDLPEIPCHIGELNQVFLNIVVNAAHAIGDRVNGTADRGTITLQTRLEDNYAVIRISDTGLGIPSELFDKIFDPFFTTKPVGKGTGQGLTIARSIVVKHGGTLSFDTVSGSGTTFEIRLPGPRNDTGEDF